MLRAPCRRAVTADVGLGPTMHARPACEVAGLRMGVGVPSRDGSRTRVALAARPVSRGPASSPPPPSRRATGPASCSRSKASTAAPRSPSGVAGRCFGIRSNGTASRSAPARPPSRDRPSPRQWRRLGLAPPDAPDAVPEACGGPRRDRLAHDGARDHCHGGAPDRSLPAIRQRHGRTGLGHPCRARPSLGNADPPIRVRLEGWEVRAVGPCAMPIRLSGRSAMPFLAPGRRAGAMSALLIALDGAIDTRRDRSVGQDPLPAFRSGDIPPRTHLGGRCRLRSARRSRSPSPFRSGSGADPSRPRSWDASRSSRPPPGLAAARTGGRLDRHERCDRIRAEARQSPAAPTGIAVTETVRGSDVTASGGLEAGGAGRRSLGAPAGRVPSLVGEGPLSSIHPAPGVSSASRHAASTSHATEAARLAARDGGGTTDGPSNDRTATATRTRGGSSRSRPMRRSASSTSCPRCGAWRQPRPATPAASPASTI